MKTSKVRDLFLTHAVNLLPSDSVVVPTAMNDMPWVYRYGSSRYGVRLERALDLHYLINLLDRVSGWREAKINRNQDRVEKFVSRYKLRDKLLLGPGRSANYWDFVSIETYSIPSPTAQHYLYGYHAQEPKNIEEMSNYVTLSAEEIAEVRSMMRSAELIMKSQHFVAILKNLINSILYAEVIERYPELGRTADGYSEHYTNSFVHVRLAGREYMIAHNRSEYSPPLPNCLSVVGSGSSGWLKQIDLDVEESLFVKKNKSLARVLKYLSNTKKNRRL